MSESVLLQLSDVGKDYQATDEGEKLIVLAGTNLSVESGETIAIVGPSGCGKSTMLNLIGALDSPSSGSVSLDGEDLGAANEKQLSDLRNRKIGFIFQSHHLLPQCSVLENVLVPVIARGPADAESIERAKRLLKRVGLGERLNHRPGQLSGGERQRVAVVRALINQPKVILADEPTGALDRNSAATLADLLLELNQEEKVTLIVVTHSLDLAKKMGRTMELRDGKLEELK
ncbi:MAG: ABC transporter ATP-binding protein [Limisphaerales bacterium]